MKEITVRLGSEDVKLSTSAYIVVMYQDLFRSNVFDDMSRITDAAVTGGSIPYAELFTLYKLCYAMAKHSDSDIVPFDEWLKKMDVFEIPMIADRLIELWVDEAKTNSTP